MRLLLLLVLSGTLKIAQAQIDDSNFDKKLLEHKLKVLVDSTRLANNLTPLFNDSILYVASDHHARYLVTKGVLSHEEAGKKEFFSPQDRANYYGAPKSYLVGENIVYTHYNASVRSKGKTFITNDYTEIARNLVHAWINSKGHFKNIINPDYQVTGLAVGIDLKEKRIYACQKFAKVMFTYTFEENTAFFPYSQLSQDSVNALMASVDYEIAYPFGLKDDKTEKCEACKETWGQYPQMSVRIARNSFILRIEEADFVKELIKNRHDGFAIEIVPFDAFACGNSAYENEPSRRNQLKRTSGQVLEPVYRKDLMKGFKKRKRKKDINFVEYLLTADSVSFFRRFSRYKLINFDANYFEIKLGKVPKNMNTWWNHNLMYIHDKQICHFVYLTNYPGELDLKMINVPYFPPIPVNDYVFDLEYFRDTLDVYYGPGETKTSSTELTKLIAKYQEKNLTIQQVHIEGYCSVEGDIKTNELLHQQRAENILSELKLFMNSDTVCTVHSQVAWDHFYSSVKDHPKWKFLYPLSKEEIVAYLTDPKNERPLDILSKERMVRVQVRGVRELSPRNAFYYIKRDLNVLFKKDRYGHIECTDEDKLVRLYEKAYYLSTVDTLLQKDFLGITIPKYTGGLSHRLQHDMAFYHYEILKNQANKSELLKLESKIESVFSMCGAAEHLSPEFHYLSACLLVEKIKQKQNNTADNPDIQKAFDRLSLLLNWYDLDSVFKLNVAMANLNIINTLCETIDPDQVFEYQQTVNYSLIQIVEYYRKTNQLNPASAVSLAKLLCYFKNIGLAVELCQEFLYDNEVLKLYLPLAYLHSSYLSSANELFSEIYFQELLMESKSRISTEEWCKLFYGKYGIPFQVMDNKALHNAFCETCPNRVNEVFEE